MRPPQMTVKWFMTLIAVMAILSALGAWFGLIVLAPSATLTFLVIVSHSGRRSPTSLTAWSSGALCVPSALTAMTSRVLCGYYFGLESPVFFAVYAMVEAFPLALILGVHRLP